jgi:hypothetical protein
VNNGLASITDSGLNPFEYSPPESTCQTFLAHMLKGNAMNDPEAMAFILQDVGYIISKINPLTKKIMSGAVGLAQFVNNLMD